MSDVVVFEAEEFFLGVANDVAEVFDSHAAIGHRGLCAQFLLALSQRSSDRVLRYRAGPVPEQRRAARYPARRADSMMKEFPRLRCQRTAHDG